MDKQTVEYITGFLDSKIPIRDNHWRVHRYELGTQYPQKFETIHVQASISLLGEPIAITRCEFVIQKDALTSYVDREFQKHHATQDQVEREFGTPTG